MTFEEWKGRFIKKLVAETCIHEDSAAMIFNDSGFEAMDDILDDYKDDPEGAALEEIASWVEHDDEEPMDMDQYYDEYEPWDGDYE